MIKASPIPISAAQRIAEEFGYDQVVVVARKVDDCEHVTTYGVDEEHCEVAARIGTTLKHHLMQWPSALFATSLRFIGVSRDAENANAIIVSCEREVEDDELRALHEFLRPTS